MKLLRDNKEISIKTYDFRIVTYTLRPHMGEEIAIIFNENSNMFSGSLLNNSFTGGEFKAHLNKIERDHMIAPRITKQVVMQGRAVVEPTFQKYEYDNVLGGANGTQYWFEIEGTQRVADIVSVNIAYNKRVVKSGVRTIETRDEETIGIPTAIYKPIKKALKKAGFCVTSTSSERGVFDYKRSSGYQSTWM